MWGSILTEWASLMFRWLHVVAAMGWIGSSFYFIHLDLSLKPGHDLPEGVQGEAWQVHGGGFYRIVKYLVAPATMPDELTWFKWEAYTTWLSGFALMVIVYYLDAELFLVDKSVLDLTPLQAGLFSFASLALAWLLYEAACRTGLARHELAFACGGYVFLVALTYAFTHVLSGRGAFNQIGALIGTIMVANVFVVIIPNQKKIVAALLAGQSPDPKLGKAGKERSVHNNYLTLPVIVLMISNHYPLLFATRFNWADRRHRAGARPGDPAFLQRAACRAQIAMVGMGRSQSRHDRDRLAVGRRSARDQDRIARGRADLRQCPGDHPVAMQHVPCRRAGVGRDRHRAERHPAGRRGSHPAQRKADRTQRGWASAMPPGNVTEMTGEERAVVAAWVSTQDR